jgi:hypothetical protein
VGRGETNTGGGTREVADRSPGTPGAPVRGKSCT